MANFNIIVRGVNLIYSKSGESAWKLIFPIAGCHDLRMFSVVWREGNPEISYLTTYAAPNRTIRITGENAIPNFGEGDEFDEFVDVTGSYMHNAGVALRDDWFDKSSFLVVSDARLSVYEKSVNDLEITRDGQEVRSARKIPNSSLLEIDASTLKLEVEEVGVNAEELESLKRVWNEDTWIVFDNDCEIGRESDNVSDMELIYDIIYDAIEDVRFTVEEPPNEDEEEDENDGEPSPGRIPCHPVRASDATSLP